jgi:hypothetical protein
MGHASHGDARVTGHDGSGASDRSLSGRTDGGPPAGRLFWLAALVGALLVAVGVAGLLSTQEPNRIAGWATWIAGSIIVHDALLAPAACAVGWLVARRAPILVRPVIQAALIVSATVAVATAPVWLERGRAAVPDNASVLPDHSYLANLALVLGVIWAVALLAIAWRASRLWRRRHSL